MQVCEIIPPPTPPHPPPPPTHTHTLRKKEKISIYCSFQNVFAMVFCQ